MSEPCVKRAYRTRQAAQRAMSKMRGRRARHDHRRMPARAYQCQRCRAWHLTSEDRGDKSGRRDR